MSEAKMTSRKVNKPGCATVRNQATALFSLPMRLGQHVLVISTRTAASRSTKIVLKDFIQMSYEGFALT